MSNDDHPPQPRPPGLFRLLRLAVALVVLLGVAWGISEHDAVVSSAVGVAPPADDAPRDPSSLDVERTAQEGIAAPVSAGAQVGSNGAMLVPAPPADGTCGSQCTGPPTLRGPPRT